MRFSTNGPCAQRPLVLLSFAMAATFEPLRPGLLDVLRSNRLS
jgi:hypothetical protein